MNLINEWKKTFKGWGGDYKTWHQSPQFKKKVFK